MRKGYIKTLKVAPRSARLSRHAPQECTANFQWRRKSSQIVNKHFSINKRCWCIQRISSLSNRTPRVYTLAAYLPCVYCQKLKGWTILKRFNTCSRFWRKYKQIRADCTPSVFNFYCHTLLFYCRSCRFVGCTMWSTHLVLNVYCTFTLSDYFLRHWKFAVHSWCSCLLRRPKGAAT